MLGHDFLVGAGWFGEVLLGNSNYVVVLSIVQVFFITAYLSVFH